MPDLNAHADVWSQVADSPEFKALPPATQALYQTRYYTKAVLRDPDVAAYLKANPSQAKTVQAQWAPAPPPDSAMADSRYGKVVGALNFLQQPISKMIGGPSLKEVADKNLPPAGTPGLVGGAAPLLRTAAGVLDFIQSPAGIAATAAEGLSGGAATPVLAPALGAQMIVGAGQEAKQAIQKPTPQNVESALMAGAGVAFGAIPAAHALQEAGKIPVVPKRPGQGPVPPQAIPVEHVAEPITQPPVAPPLSIEQQGLIGQSSINDAAGYGPGYYSEAFEPYKMPGVALKQPLRNVTPDGALGVPFPPSAEPMRPGQGSATPTPTIPPTPEPRPQAPSAQPTRSEINPGPGPENRPLEKLTQLDIIRQTKEAADASDQLAAQQADLAKKQAAIDRGKEELNQVQQTNERRMTAEGIVPPEGGRRFADQERQAIQEEPRAPEATRSAMPQLQRQPLMPQRPQARNAAPPEALPITGEAPTFEALARQWGIPDKTATPVRTTSTATPPNVPNRDIWEEAYIRAEGKQQIAGRPKKAVAEALQQIRSNTVPESVKAESWHRDVERPVISQQAVRAASRARSTPTMVQGSTEIKGTEGHVTLSETLPSEDVSPEQRAIIRERLAQRLATATPEQKAAYETETKLTPEEEAAIKPLPTTASDAKRTLADDASTPEEKIAAQKVLDTQAAEPPMAKHIRELTQLDQILETPNAIPGWQKVANFAQQRGEADMLPWMEKYRTEFGKHGDGQLAASRIIDELKQKDKSIETPAPTENLQANARARLVKRMFGPEGEKGAIMVPKEETETIQSHLKDAADTVGDLVKMVAGHEIGVGLKAGEKAWQILRTSMGRSNRALSITKALLPDIKNAKGKLTSAEQYMDTLPRDAQLQLIRDIDQAKIPGKPVATDPKLQPLADSLRKALDNSRERVQDLGTGKLEEFYANYFPKIAEKPGTIGRIMSKRPFMGSAAFLKKSASKNFDEFINNGNTPISYNPVTLIMHRITEMEKYVRANETLQQWKVDHLAGQFEPQEIKAGKLPEGWQRVGTIGSNWFAPPEVATMLDRFLSSGMPRGGAWDMTRNFFRSATQLKLGASVFHGALESVGSAAVDMATAISQAINKKGKASVFNIGKSAIPGISLIDQAIIGNKVMQEYKSPGSYPKYANAAQGMERGNFKFSNEDYVNQSAQRFKRAIADKDWGTASWRAVPYALEKAAKPLMGMLIPRVKAGAFARIMENELSKLPADTPKDTFDAIAQRTTDTVDNLLGQINWENINWHRLLKDSLQATYMAPGFTLGTLRGIKNFGKDWVQQGTQVLTGEKAEITPDMLMPLAYTGVLAVYGSMLYAAYHHAQLPSKTVDMFYIPNGGTNPDGTPSRDMIASYMRTVNHLRRDPAGLLTSTMSPTLQMLEHLYTNKTFTGEEIQHPGDPWQKKALAVGQEVAETYVPISVSQGIAAYKGKESLGGILSRGFSVTTPAPRYVDKTPTEELADSIASEAYPNMRTSEAVAKETLHNQLRIDINQANSMQPLRDAKRAKQITDQEAEDLWENRKLSRLQNQVKHFQLQDAINVYQTALSKGTPTEVKQLRPLLYEKMYNKADSDLPEDIKAVATAKEMLRRQ